MRDITVDGVTYTVSDLMRDPSARIIYLGNQVVGKIGVWGGRYRLLTADGTPTNHYAARNDEGVEVLVERLHRDRH